jgi:hypothetical protein
MATQSRTVQDTDGRSWACRQDDATTPREGQDVSILCTTQSVTVPVRISIGWQWMTMADNGLARIIAEASPVPKNAM